MRMRKTWWIITTVLVIALLGLITNAMLAASEPKYAGKSLSAWLKVYNQNPAVLTITNEADDAVRKIGTAGIPTLLRLLQARDSSFKLRVVGLAQKLPFLNYRHWPAASRRFAALQGFRLLGAGASNAVPALIRIYENHDSDEVQLAASLALKYIGPASAKAVPMLLRFATNSIEALRWRAIDTLGGIHARADIVVPVLTRALRDPSASVRINAADALGNFGPEAKPATAALLISLRDELVKSRAEEALEKIDPSALAQNAPVER